MRIIGKNKFNFCVRRTAVQFTFPDFRDKLRIAFLDSGLGQAYGREIASWVGVDLVRTTQGEPLAFTNDGYVGGFPGKPVG